ncbi:MAG: 2-oxoacid:acceptor oxidoreductase subunit alpha [Deltaproteobacteria bacterium]|nr:2-oxoacid:acceptor oxidoreductase subunit alpha [Deltaproteobacteria bacterium]
MNGDEASAEGALAAGCGFFAGYPITPATEVAERMSNRLPEIGGVFIQMEDEIASMAALLGASWGGVKAMTSTSGPGFSLMMENIGLGMMTETPCVVVNIQRAGPSTGLPTLVGQADVMQCRWGSHGDYGVIALAPGSAQEMFDLTIEAFNLSETYRQPVFIMSDEIVGHMFEKVVIPPADHIRLVPRRKPTTEPWACIPFQAEDGLVPPMACAGEGFRVHVTGLTHDEMGYPHIVPPTQERLVRRLVDKIRLNARDIIRLESHFLEDAETVVVAYGCVARSARESVQRARSKGLKVGILRLITLWPFPTALIRELSKTVRTFVVPEINYGQMAYEVERCAGDRAQTVLVGMMGGTMHTPTAILEVIEEFSR